MHKADVVNIRKRSHGDVQKPKVIQGYNQKMGKLDKNNAMIRNYSSIRKTYKWYIKIFFPFPWRNII